MIKTTETREEMLQKITRRWLQLHDLSMKVATKNYLCAKTDYQIADECNYFWKITSNGFTFDELVKAFVKQRAIIQTDAALYKSIESK